MIADGNRGCMTALTPAVAPATTGNPPAVVPATTGNPPAVVPATTGNPPAVAPVTTGNSPAKAPSATTGNSPTVAPAKAPSAPVSATCGNNRLETGEACDGGVGCNPNCTCPTGYSYDGNVANPGCRFGVPTPPNLSFGSHAEPVFLAVALVATIAVLL
jgi:hypothetical protein